MLAPICGMLGFLALVVVTLREVFKIIDVHQETMRLEESKEMKK